MTGRGKSERARLQHVRKRARIIFRIGRDLGEGDIAGRPNELAKLAVRHRSAINPEAVDGHVMNRRLFRIMLVRPHAEDIT